MVMVSQLVKMMWHEKKTKKPTRRRNARKMTRLKKATQTKIMTP
jgi:hypothetical protein